MCNNQFRQTFQIDFFWDAILVWENEDLFWRLRKIAQNSRWFKLMNFKAFRLNGWKKEKGCEGLRRNAKQTAFIKLETSWENGCHAKITWGNKERSTRS